MKITGSIPKALWPEAKAWFSTPVGGSMHDDYEIGCLYLIPHLDSYLWMWTKDGWFSLAEGKHVDTGTSGIQKLFKIGGSKKDTMHLLEAAFNQGMIDEPAIKAARANAPET